MILRRLARERRGGVGVAVAGMMPVLIGFTAFAVDVGAVQLDSRRLQGIADAAALAAAGAPSDAAARAQAVVSVSDFPRPVTLRQVDKGDYSLDPKVAVANRFIKDAPTPDAAHVVLESTTPTFFARIFGRDMVTIAGEATARRQHYAAFAIGSRLASVNGGILNAYLGALTGTGLNLTVMDYNALAGAQVDLLGLLPLVRTQADLTAASYKDILDTQVALPKVLNALAESLLSGGNKPASDAVKLIANVTGGQSVTLSSLIDAGPLGAQQAGGGGTARVDALSLITAMLQLGGGKRQVSLDLGTSVAGLASTKLTLAVGERMQHSPWITVTDHGATIVRTAQARIYVRTTLLPISVPGIGSLLSINLPILVELASAQGRLASIDCPGTGARTVSLEGKTDPGSATVGTVNEDLIGDFSVALQPVAAELVSVGLGPLLPLIGVKAEGRISLGAAEPWQKVTFNAGEIAQGTRKTIGSSKLLTSVASSLISSTKVYPTIGILTLPILGTLVSAVGEALKPAAALLDPLLISVTGALGVGLGEADLQVTGMRCGQTILVA